MASTRYEQAYYQKLKDAEPDKPKARRSRGGGRDLLGTYSGRFAFVRWSEVGGRTCKAFGKVRVAGSLPVELTFANDGKVHRLSIPRSRVIHLSTRD